MSQTLLGYSQNLYPVRRLTLYCELVSLLHLENSEWNWKGHVGTKIERAAEWRRICFHRISSQTFLFSLSMCGDMEVG
jgi:hypothetical protein